MAWYMLRTAVNQEKTRVFELEHTFAGLACSVFLPRYVCARRYEGAWHMESRLLFPGYIFVDTERPDAVKKRMALLSGVEQVGSGGFFPIQPAEQEFLQGLLSPDYEVGYSVGDLRDGKLVIASGPLAAYTDRVRRIDRHKRLAEVEYTLCGEAGRMRLGLEIRSKDGGTR